MHTIFDTLSNADFYEGLQMYSKVFKKSWATQFIFLLPKF